MFVVYLDQKLVGSRASSVYMTNECRSFQVAVACSKWSNIKGGCKAKQKHNNYVKMNERETTSILGMIMYLVPYVPRPS